MTTLKLYAFCQIDADLNCDWSKPQFVKIFGFADDAETVAARFPKSSQIVSGRDWLSSRVDFMPTIKNGGRNESGIRRYRSWVRAAEKAGIELEWEYDATVRNAYLTRKTFENGLETL
jgi:hypothetical protein